MEFQEFRQEFANELMNWPMRLLIASTAIGFLTMTVIEIWKTSWRYTFHRDSVFKWLIESVSPYRHDDHKLIKNRILALDQLIMFSTAGNQRSFYSLPIEGLCGQISAGVQSMLEAPAKNRHVIELLVGGQKLQDSDVKVDIENFIKERPKTNEGGYDEEFVTARSRVAAHIQRNLDSFQINTSFEWREQLRRRSIVSGFFLALIPALFSLTWKNLVPDLIFVFLAGYIGAFVASIFSDLRSVIEKNKR